MTFSESGSFLSDEFVIKMGKQIKNITKQTVEIRPSNSQTSYTNNQRILFQIPYSSTFSTKDLALHFTGKYSDQLKEAGSPMAAALFPKDMNIFSDIIVRINGKIVSSFSNRYNDVCAILGNFKNRNNPTRSLLQNGTPEHKSYLNTTTGAITTISNIEHDTNADYVIDKGEYVITQWEGLLGNSTSASFLDSRILGEITIEFVIAPVSVGIAGSGDEGASKETSDEKAKINNDISFNLSDLKLSMQRYNLDPSYYEGIDRNLSSGSTYKIAFDHYDIFSKGATTTQDSLMFNINAHDIKYMFGFFNHSDRDALLRPQTKFLCEQDNFFNSYWYDYSAIKFSEGQFQVGSTLVPQNPLKPTDCMLELVRMYDIKQDSSNGVVGGIADMANFRKHYFVCPLSFEFCEDKSDGRVISGLSTEGLPLAISWNYKLSGAPTNKNANVLVATTRVLTINNGAVVDVQL